MQHICVGYLNGFVGFNCSSNYHQSWSSNLPLGFGGGFPFIETFVLVLIPELILLLVGYGNLEKVWNFYLCKSGNKDFAEINR